ncbi:tyrosine-type recombinase/integrase [Blastomonas sp.]|uniref:tyrosine-type recombinase/integrase n=1 Tax=Blastomonas sp. TaxID=1909299 RepID=UPI002624E4A7|nr:tyrosine-type recombinase/integrase [Blastomonas sp.]MDM7956024.1 tyrosine-type recombinase/integrase [Blastomonas sp.]
MSRRRSKANRFLPKYVSLFKDRHGKERLRFRRKGYPSQYFTAPLGTEAFREEYHRFNSAEIVAQAAASLAAERCPPGSIGDLLRRYVAIPERLGPSEVTQIKVRNILERFAEGREDRPVRGIRFEHIDAIIAKARIKTLDHKGRTVGGVEAARKLRKELRRFFAFARKLGWIATNPVDDSQQIRVSPSERSTGFYTWTEDDITQYRTHWPLGSKQRLAMELMLWTDQRKVDAIHLGRQHIRNGKFELRQTKTGKLLTLPIAPPLADAIAAMPKSDAMCFLMTEWGRPFSVKGFGGWFREQCDAAGLPKCTAHGLRKATMRRMAELEMPNKTMKSVSGHSKDDEIARYTEAANQERLARSAINQLVDWEKSNPQSKLDTK